MAETGSKNLEARLIIADGHYFVPVFPYFYKISLILFILHQ